MNPEEFANIVFEALGPMENVRRTDPKYVESYRGKLPDALLSFWQDYGWGSFKDGPFWLCDPGEFTPLLDNLFENDPTPNAKDFLAYTYDAFGHLRLWNSELKDLDIHFRSMNSISPKTKRSIPSRSRLSPTIK